MSLENFMDWIGDHFGVVLVLTVVVNAGIILGIMYFVWAVVGKATGH